LKPTNGIDYDTVRKFLWLWTTRVLMKSGIL